MMCKFHHEEVRTNRSLLGTVGIKDDAGKPRMDLIPGEVLLELGKLFAMGAVKYSDNNWRLGMRYGKVIAALERHLQKWKAGEDRDPVDGQHHLDSVIWSAIVLRYYEYYREHYAHNDDRWIPEKKLPRPVEGKEGHLVVPEDVERAIESMRNDDALRDDPSIRTGTSYSIRGSRDQGDGFFS